MSKTIYVSASANAAIANGSSANPFASIQAAINAAQDGDSILLGDGIYKGNGNRDISLSGKAVSIRSQNGPGKTIVDAERAGRFLTVGGTASDNVEISGITFQGAYFTHNGDWTGRGLATFETDAAVSIKNCKFIQSEILATYVTSGSTVIKAVGKGKVTLENVLIDSNKIGGGDTGGRAYVIEGNVDVLQSSVTNNTIFTSADWNWWGGDIRATMILSPGCKIENSIIYGNSPAKVDWKAWGSVPLIAQADVYVGGEDPKNLPEGSVLNSVVQGVLFAKTQQNVFKDVPQNYPELGFSDAYLISDTIYSDVSYTLKGAERNLILTGSAAINGTGNELDNSLTGNAAANVLDGRAGNDTLQGGGGNDTLLGGDGSDLLIAGGASGLSKFEIVEGSFTWEQAKADAESRGGHLATIGSETEWNELKAILPDAIVLLGATDSGSEGSWKWIDGTPWTFSNWNWGEPNGWTGENYLMAWPSSIGSTWNDTNQTTRSFYALERKEVASRGNASLSGGVGNDTLRGGAGSNTLDGGDGNDLLVSGLGNGGSTYEFVRATLTWDQAKMDSEARGGHLVTITSQAELSSIKAQLGTNYSNDLWLGATSANGDGRWSWVTGEVFDFSLWDPVSYRQPIDVGWPAPHAAHKWAGRDTWDDASHDYNLAAGYILEIPMPLAGENSLLGGAGNDTLQGSLGNDTLDGGAGADSMVGGGGNDAYYVDNFADVLSEQAMGGSDSVFSSVSHTLGANFENLAASSSAGLSLRGNDLQNFITGGSGADTLDGGGTDGVIRIAIFPAPIIPDTLSGGLGNDLYITSSAFDRDVIIEAAGGGIDTVQSSVAHSLAANVENLVLTGSAAISGTGNGLANQITGNSAANRLAAAGGNDRVLGGAGNDTLNAGTGLDTVRGEAGNDLLQIDWTNLIGAAITRNVRKDGTGTGASFSGSYIAKNLAGQVLSSVAFDGIERLALNGQNVDLELAVAAPGVTIKRISPAAVTTEQGGIAEYSVVLDKAPRENVSLAFASTDATEGKVNTPTLTFTPLNWNTPQKLVVQGVDDYLDDGNVAYNITGRVITNDLTYNRIFVPVISLLNNDDGRDRDQNIYGTEDTDYLEGMDGNDRIYGKGGQDQIQGGIGNDRLYGQEDNDRLFGESGNDQLYGGYDDDRLEGGADNDFLFGEQGLDTLIGGAGNDYLDGGIENDSMSGGAGNDTYFVESAGDIINDLGLVTDVDTVLLLQTINYTLPANIENASISSPGNANLTGNTLNNGLTGNDGRNVLDGGVGNDSLNGGAGADSLLGGLGNDVFAGGAGNDTMRGGDGVDLADFAAAGVDLSVDLSTGRVTGDGTDIIFDIENILAGEGNDTLLGNGIGNDLDGGSGIDNLNGGGGNDTLAGCFFGAGGGRGEIDTLTGGSGIDIFQLGWASGRFYDDGIAANAGRNDYVLITDFTVGQDRLQLDGAAGSYFFGASGLNGVSGIGLYAEQGATDELIAIIRSANTTQLTAANTINTAQFV